MMPKWRMPPWRKSPLPPHLQLKSQGPAVMPLPPDVAHLCKEANKALEDLLAVKSSIDAQWWKLVSEFSMALHQNNSEAMESIKEVKAICAHSIQEAENCCSVAIREVEAQRVSQAISLQQSHHKIVQCLEEESFEEERKSQLNFSPSARLPCGPALQSSMVHW